MGYRIHARRINRIEHGTGLLNCEHKGTVEILSSFSEDFWISDDEKSMEIPKEHLAEGIEKIKSISETEFDKEYGKSFFDKISKEEIVEALQTLLDDADPECDTVYMDWF